MLTCGRSTGGTLSWLFYAFRCFDDGARGDHNTRCHNHSSLEVLVHFGMFSKEDQDNKNCNKKLNYILIVPTTTIPFEVTKTEKH